MIYFPEIFNNHPDKFNRLSVWLVNYESIICPNIRDIFTAGGKKNFLINGVMHEKLPQIVFRLLTKKVEIKKMLKSIPKDELKKHWGDLPKDILKHWANQVSTNAKHFNLSFNLESILLK
ncbi:MAG: hypothetical protein HYV28_18370 [Ignavibacteriales bacterium]|nr:hypothetical protein [Ignavibacteriales bacterium]